MVAPKDRKLLQLFHLRQINNATFITYVYPLLMLIRRLVYKRGYVKHRNSRIPKLRAVYKLQSFKNNNDKQFATKRAQWSKFLPGIRWLVTQFQYVEYYPQSSLVLLERASFPQQDRSHLNPPVCRDCGRDLSAGA
ncbi:hypothetical protein quinque_009842 [Culex quinquefasciatus]